MSLKDTLLKDLKSAMKEKDQIAKSTIQMVRAAILQVEKDNKTTLDDEGIVEVVAKQLKQRKDSLREFKKAERADLVEQTKKEIEVLMGYLPKQLSESEIREIVKKAVSETGAKTMRDMGKIMQKVMPKVKGKADGKQVNQIAREFLD